MSSLEDLLSSWTGPASTTEQERQDRTERMIREAIEAHEPLRDCSRSVFAKGSYPNNTNVKSDSDVDIAVQCHDVEYWEEAESGCHTGGTPYTGIWTPTRLRDEILVALEAKFPGQVSSDGSTAIHVDSCTSRVEADVVPCFDYKYYFASGGSREGTRIVTKAGLHFENFPVQHLDNGKAKNNRTGTKYKKAVRILKRAENAMVEDGAHSEVPSFFVESLVYNCPDAVFSRSTWTDTISAVLVHVWEGLQGEEPTDESSRWLEVNECKYLFHSAQKWTRSDGRNFANAAWNYLGYGE